MPKQLKLTEGREARMVARPLEYRAGTEDQPATLEGYAAVFESRTRIGGSGPWAFDEEIAAGAFARAVREDDVRALFNHDESLVLGRSAARTLELAEDRDGLRTVIHPPDTSAARDVVALVERGDVTGMSFSFRVRDERWTEPSDEGGVPLRRILDVDLYDVGPVTFPAYEETSIAARDQASGLAEAVVRAQLRAADEDRLRVLWLARAQAGV